MFMSLEQMLTFLCFGPASSTAFFTSLSSDRHRDKNRDKNRDKDKEPQKHIERGSDTDTGKDKNT